MPNYIHELVCLDSLGNLSVAHLTIVDDDNSLTSQEPGVVYTIDGEVLAAAPIVTIGTVDLTLLDGSARFPLAMSFDLNGNQYFMINPETPADFVSSAANYTSFGAVGDILYTVYGASESDIPRPYQGTALIQTFSDGDVLVDTQVLTVTVFDDDRFVEINGANGAPNSETGAAASGHFGYQGQEHSFNDTDAGAGNSRLVLVRVDYTGPGGAGSFEAIKYFYEQGPDYAIAYIPRLGSVNLADVTTVTGVTVLATSLNGKEYSDFGLGFDTTPQNGTSANDVFSGTWLHDTFRGNGGADALIGSMGEDKLYGGRGDDQLFGGMHADRAEGGGGSDILFGRSYDDDLLGQDGADSVYGGFGNDTLDGGKGDDMTKGNEGDDLVSGGKGHDTLYGSDGNDTLDGGNGDDELRGGFGDDQITDGNGADLFIGHTGVDVFIFGTDGATDQINDYNDGFDLIDLSTAFRNLSFTDIAPGEVHITHSGEVLILTDTTGTLTSADLTRADFI